MYVYHAGRPESQCFFWGVSVAINALANMLRVPPPALVFEIHWHQLCRRPLVLHEQVGHLTGKGVEVSALQAPQDI